MSKNLVIVESPSKAKTIEGYLGEEYIVKSSLGHVRDLPKNDKAIDVSNRFTPTYEISSDKKEVIKSLKALSSKADTIYLASDDDREGEAISWHLKEALGLQSTNTKRIVFREITKKAVLNAIKNPRDIDIDLVNAQQARRILDRLVGFKLSPLLWSKIRSRLSAGRVQSVAVRMIVEREREIEKFNSSSVFKIFGFFSFENEKIIKAELSKTFSTEEEATIFLKKCIGAEYSIENLEKKIAKRSPSSPFTTSTLQQEAGNKFGFSVVQTMRVAQSLYEAGKISYMRTDSVNLSDEAIEKIKNQIQTLYGENFVEIRRYKTKSESAQEAHEAIRPTDFSVTSTGKDDTEKKLYNLIWKRTIASQMKDAQIEKNIVTIKISTTSEKFIATGETILFEGFLKVYSVSKEEDDDEEKESDILPPMQIGNVLYSQKIYGKQTFSKPKPRYSEPTLVREMEELGIGRPSTYAPTLATIVKREYVIKESREAKERKFIEITLIKNIIETKTLMEKYGSEKSKLFPTQLAFTVNSFLIQHFPDIVDYNFTANIEKEFDEIADGKIQWQDMIENFYTQFLLSVENTQNIERSSFNQERILGINPTTGDKITIKTGRFGAFAQMGENTDEKKAKTSALKKGQYMENITLEEAMELFKLPKNIGLYENETMSVNIGKYGPYIKHKDEFYSIGKEKDPITLTEEEAITIIEALRIQKNNKILKQFSENNEIQILNGIYGPYIKFQRKNIKMPKGKKPEDITYLECLELIEKAPESQKKNIKNKKNKLS